MKRRDFLKTLSTAAACFTVLPAATTYSRIWKPKLIVRVRYEINPEWVNAPFEMRWFGNNFATIRHELYPPRFRMEADEFVLVPTFTFVKV